MVKDFHFSVKFVKGGNLNMMKHFTLSSGKTFGTAGTVNSDHNQRLKIVSSAK